MTGLEPATTRPPDEYSTKLSYTPYMLPKVEPKKTTPLSVGVAGFEPAALCSQSRYANRTALHPESLVAVRAGFEPAVRVSTYDSLANCWFQPLTHLTSSQAIFLKQLYKQVRLSATLFKNCHAKVKHLLTCQKFHHNFFCFLFNLVIYQGLFTCGSLRCAYVLCMYFCSFHKLLYFYTVYLAYLLRCTEPKK